MGTPDALHLASVTRCEKGVTKALLEDVTLRIPEGTLAALVGPDGAGKTTLMRIAAGILQPQEGSVEIFGHDIYQETSSEKASSLVGYMPQKFGLYEDLTVMENFLLYADLFALSEENRRERFGELLAMTDLTRFTERPAGKLSGGMKQKLGLACALLNRPPLLLLDEPTVGVDPLSRRELWSILKRAVGRGKMTALVATTYTDEAALCDAVFLLDKGHLTLKGTPEAIAARAKNRTGLVFHPSLAPRVLQAQLSDERDSVLDAVPAAGGVHILLKEHVPLEAFADTHHDLRVIPQTPTLEDGWLASEAANTEPTPHSAVTELTGAMSVADPVIRAKGIVRRFGNFTAVDQTTFDVHPGEIFGLLGPNGAGKTTTFRMLCGLIEVTEGELEVAGCDVRKSRAASRRNLGYMSQKFALYGNLTSRENLEFFAGAQGLNEDEAKKRVEELLKDFDLKDSENRAAGDLPGGVKQRLAMTAALVARPALLFLDEPTSGADVPTRRSFWRRMTELAKAGVTIIVTTHFMEEAEYCDRLIIQDAGKTLALGTPQEIRGTSPTMNDAFIGIVENARLANEKKKEGVTR